ncbi:hypothetical protein CPB83DRAFT_897637 [Crepidotus variabilis]|uniref:Uncharacterized protein n=1 Tax=Crepidotus variabilis TaxID=179855 RepID=A0A9P6E8X1_9AGAR|nr:hypothetical protein CPB83DRAFT_897637 [Crepidotus variabilis]
MQSTTSQTPQVTMPSQKPTPPSFGYLIVGRPMEAKFQSIGQYFHVSYLPYQTSENAVETLMGKDICLWLGGKHFFFLPLYDFEELRLIGHSLDAVDTEILAYIIWPGAGILILGEGLNSGKPSRMVKLGVQSGSFESGGSNANIIMQELLYLGPRPCVLFVRSLMQEDFLQEEAARLSFRKRAVDWVCDLEGFLDAAALSGNAVQSSQIHHWHRKVMIGLQTADRTSFLFDPTRFLVGMLKHLHQTLLRVNHLDVNKMSKTGGPVNPRYDGVVVP